MNSTAEQGLLSDLKDLFSSFDGDIGFYLHHLETGFSYGYNENTVLPTASLIKLGILLGIFEKIEHNELQLDDTFPHFGEHNYVYEADLVNRTTHGTRFSLKVLLHLMLSLSDNTASLWLQHLAGGGYAINNLLKTLGFPNTSVNSRTPTREHEYKQFGWGQSTAIEMCSLLTFIHSGSYFSRANHELMYRLLTKSFWDSEALSQIPMGFATASKQGAVSKSKNEVVMIHTQKGLFCFAILTTHRTVSNYEPNHPGNELIRKVAKVLYNYISK